MMLESERFESEPHLPRMADAASNLLDAHFALGDGLLRGLLRTTSSPPHVCSRHGPLPPSTWRASDNRCSTLQCHAHGRSARPWSIASIHPAPPEPCCADWWIRDSW